ncbi:DUF6417 family protein [Streptomyces griseoaurantiacus]|uniref:DUF6417 family protein n=1 Tax=Streptomyces griseoaurantiacus TaxID=68213 RepID=UPI003697668C
MDDPDDYEHIEITALHSLSQPQMGERLALLTLEEAHDVLHLLVGVAGEGGALSQEADRLARELAARIPSEN